MRKSFLLTCLVLTGAMSSLTAIGADVPASKNDWPSWRGPKRDAISTEKGLLTEWPEDGPEVLWTTKDLGRGFASIAISGARIYTMGDRKERVSDLSRPERQRAMGGESRQRRSELHSDGGWQPCLHRGSER